MALPNKYPGRCLVCDVTLEPGMGVIERAGSQWVCFCRNHTPKTAALGPRPVEKKKTSEKTLDLD